jgi:hypothetical protein
MLNFATCEGASRVDRNRAVARRETLVFAVYDFYKSGIDLASIDTPARPPSTDKAGEFLVMAHSLVAGAVDAGAPTADCHTALSPESACRRASSFVLISGLSY